MYLLKKYLICPLKRKSKPLGYGNIENIVRGDDDIDIKYVWKWNYLGVKESTMCEGQRLEKQPARN